MYINEDMTAVPLLDMVQKIENELSEPSQADFSVSLAELLEDLSADLQQFEMASGPLSDAQKLEILLLKFYQEWQFKGDWQTFYEYRNTEIKQVLSQRQGIPMTLGIILRHCCQHIGLDANGICFPGNFLVSLVVDGKMQYLDPFNGQFLSWQDMEVKLRGSQGNLARLETDNLTPDDDITIARRLLQVKKAALLREHQYAGALLCADIILRLVPGDPFEVRDRGFIYHELDCINVAINDFKYFIEKCPDDPSSHLLKVKLEQMDDAQTIMH